MASPPKEPAAGSGGVDVAVDSYHDADDSGRSAYDSELQSYTTSMSSSVEDYKHEHGRRYHAFREGNYVFPNDEKEMDRLDLMHLICELALDKNIYLAPIKSPKRVLDLGTGTGIWAMDMGDKFPDADILGNDLSPIQPKWVPPNVHFEVDDIESEWTYSTKFDFIHCRCLYSAVKDWPRLFQQTYDNLNPGAYAEFIDLDLAWHSPDGSHKGTMAEDVNQKTLAALDAAGLIHSPGPQLEGWMKAKGFEDVHVRKCVTPIGTWPKDKKLKEIGAYNHVMTMEGLESFFLAVFTRMLQYSKEEVDVMLAKVRQNIKDPNVHLYFDIYDVYGRKPGETSSDKLEENPV